MSVASGDRTTTHYSDIQRGLFTKQVRRGDNTVGCPAHEVDALNAAVLAAKSDNEIRALAHRLEAARKTLQVSP
jgi:prophage regulatory protein